MKWIFTNQFDVFLCKSCNHIFDGINSSEKLNICPRCQFPICFDCIKSHKFCNSCIGDAVKYNFLVSCMSSSSNLLKISF